MGCRARDTLKIWQKAIADAESSLGECSDLVQGRIEKIVLLRHQAYEQGRQGAVRLGAMV